MYACENSSAVCGGDMADVLAEQEVFTITFGGLTKQPFTIGGGDSLAYARNPFSAAPCSNQVDAFEASSSSAVPEVSD